MNELLVTFVVILLPGILAAVIADKITIHQRWDAFKFTLYAILLGVGCYAGVQVIVWCINAVTWLCVDEPSWHNLQIWSSALSEGDGLLGREVVFATAMSGPVAALAALLINYKVFNRIAQKIRVTTKYGDENLYSYFLNAREIDWIYIRDPENNLTYQGRVVSHSENDSMQEIVLSDVSVYRYEDSTHLYDVPSLYLSRPLGLLTIEAIPEDRMEPVDEQKN